MPDDMVESDVSEGLAGLSDYRSIDEDDLLGVLMTAESRKVPPPVPGMRYRDLQSERIVQCVSIDPATDVDTRSVPPSEFTIKGEDSTIKVSPATWVLWRSVLFRLTDVFSVQE